MTIICPVSRAQCGTGLIITPAPRGKLCGVGRNHPATEHYEFSDHGGGLDRCEKHGGAKMRDMLRDRGHEVGSRL